MKLRENDVMLLIVVVAFESKVHQVIQDSNTCIVNNFGAAEFRTV